MQYADGHRHDAGDGCKGCRTCASPRSALVARLSHAYRVQRRVNRVRLLACLPPGRHDQIADCMLCGAQPELPIDVEKQLGVEPTYTATGADPGACGARCCAALSASP